MKTIKLTHDEQYLVLLGLNLLLVNIHMGNEPKKVKFRKDILKIKGKLLGTKSPKI